MEKYLEAASQALDEVRPETLFTLKPGPKRPARVVARAVIGRFARRAWRRPLVGSELERLVGLYEKASKKGLDFEPAVKVSLKAVLASPHFLFRIERDKPGDEPYAISDYELASRLSYFLWSTMLDDELLRLAGQGKLRDPKVLETQVQRMVASPKFEEFALVRGPMAARARALHDSPARPPEVPRLHALAARRDGGRDG
jgi:hypothetical protein